MQMHMPHAGVLGAIHWHTCGIVQHGAPPHVCHMYVSARIKQASDAGYAVEADSHAQGSDASLILCVHVLPVVDQALQRASSPALAASCSVCGAICKYHASLRRMSLLLAALQLHV